MKSTGSKLKQKGKYYIKDNMWYHSDFAEFLQNEYGQEGMEDPYL